MEQYEDIEGGRRGGLQEVTTRHLRNAGGTPQECPEDSVLLAITFFR